MDSPSYQQINGALKNAGFIARGCLSIVDIPQAERCSDMADFDCLILVGNAGAAFWENFSAANDGSTHADPMDDWTRQSLEKLATHWNAKVLFPFEGPPFLPFQRWALRADSVAESPLRLLFHSEYGLWHAYRGAMLLTNVPSDVPDISFVGGCSDCIEKPCLKSCPVNACSLSGYDAPDCLQHLESNAGESCMEQGCAARLACPFGGQFCYVEHQRRFHMQAFRNNYSQLIKKEQTYE